MIDGLHTALLWRLSQDSCDLGCFDSIALLDGFHGYATFWIFYFCWTSSGWSWSRSLMCRLLDYAFAVCADFLIMRFGNPRFFCNSQDLSLWRLPHLWSRFLYKVAWSESFRILDGRLRKSAPVPGTSLVQMLLWIYPSTMHVCLCLSSLQKSHRNTTFHVFNFIRNYSNWGH